MPWVKVPLAAAEQQLKRAAIRCNEPLSRVTLVWLKIQESAQQLNADGEFELDRVELAFGERVDEDKIDAIVREFESEAVALIVDGRCATFVPMEPSRDQRHRLRAKEHGAGDKGTAGDAASETENAAQVPGQNPDLHAAKADGAVIIENREAASREGASASREVVSASRFGAESSESRERKESKIPSGSVVCERLHDATTMIRERLISEIVKVANGRIAENVIRAGVPIVEKWAENGFDLERDILPEIAEIAAKSTKPLISFSAAFIPIQIAARRAQRLAEQQPRAGPATATPRKSGNLRMQALREIYAEERAREEGGEHVQFA